MENNKNITDKWLEDFIAKSEEEKKQINEIFSNRSYFNWLINFTENMDSFCEDTWQYCPEEITDEDLKKVFKLRFVYNGIKEYAKRNYIYPTDDKFGLHYNIKIDNIGFKIGHMGEGTTVFYCSKVSLNKEEIFISVDDLIKRKKQPNTKNISDLLNRISNLIVEVYNNDVPLEAIIDTIDSTITNVQIEEGMSKNNEKIKKKYFL